MSDLKIRTSMNIAASADAAWQLFGEGFAGWAAWAPGIDRSELEGPLAEGVVRVNQTAALGTMRQELVRFDRDARALAYAVQDGLPPFLVGMRNDWEIEVVDAGHCRLTGLAVFQLAEHAVPMRAKLEGKMGMSLEAFAAAARDTVERARG